GKDDIAALAFYEQADRQFGHEQAGHQQQGIACGLNENCVDIAVAALAGLAPDRQLDIVGLDLGRQRWIREGLYAHADALLCIATDAAEDAETPVQHAVNAEADKFADAVAAAQTGHDGADAGVAAVEHQPFLHHLLVAGGFQL